MTIGNPEEHPWELTEGILADIPEPGLPWRLATVQDIKVKKAALLGKPPPPPRGMRDRPPPPSTDRRTKGQPAPTAGPALPASREGPTPGTANAQPGQQSSTQQGIPPSASHQPPQPTNGVPVPAHSAPPHQPPPPTSAPPPPQHTYQPMLALQQSIPPRSHMSQYLPPPWAGGPRHAPPPPNAHHSGPAIPAPLARVSSRPEPYTKPYTAMPSPPPPRQPSPPRVSLVNYENPLDGAASQASRSPALDRARPPYLFPDDRRRSPGHAGAPLDTPSSRPS